MRWCLLVFMLSVMSAPCTDSSPRLRVLSALNVPAAGLPGNHYVLTRTDPINNTVRGAEYWLDFPQHRLMRREQGPDGVVTTWVSPVRGWQQHNGVRRCLNASERGQALASLRYHFYYLFSQPTTQLTEVVAADETDGATPIMAEKWRVEAAPLESFVIELNASGQIVALEFASGRGVERNYRLVDGVWWPFRFESFAGDKRQLIGEFSQFTIRPVAMELDRADAERRCIAAPASEAE